MFPMESFMERQWEPGPWKGVFVSFPSRVNKKNQQLHFCKLLIFRMEDGVVCAIEQIEAN